MKQTKKLAFEVNYYDCDTYNDLWELKDELTKDGWIFKGDRTIKVAINSYVIRGKFVKGEFAPYNHEFLEEPSRFFRSEKR